MIKHGKLKEVEIDEYKELAEEISDLQTKSDQQSLKKVVQLTPDDYDAWSKITLNESAIKTNTISISVNPKSYIAWHYRKMLPVNIKEEDELTKMLLKVDSRNFHCWSYRRFLKLGTVKDYFNYSSLHDLILKDEIKDFKPIIFTNTAYEAVLHLFRFSKSEFCYKNGGIEFKNPFFGEIIFDQKNYKFEKPVKFFKIEKAPKIIDFNSKKFKKNKKCGVSLEEINFLLSITPDCLNLHILKFFMTGDLQIKEKLKEMDSMRYHWYENLKEFEEFYDYDEFN